MGYEESLTDGRPLWKRWVPVLDFFDLNWLQVKRHKYHPSIKFSGNCCLFLLFYNKKNVTHTRTEHFICFFFCFRTSVQYQHFAKPGCNFFFFLSKNPGYRATTTLLKHNTRQPERYTFLFHFRNCVAINILAITYIRAASHDIIP